MHTYVTIICTSAAAMSVGGRPAWHGPRATAHLWLLLEMLAENTLMAMLRMAWPGVMRSGDGGRCDLSRLSLCVESLELLLPVTCQLVC